MWTAQVTGVKTFCMSLQLDKVDKMDPSIS